MKKLLVILGPTATGKTDLALKLTKKFNGELVSCDSRQVYKGLDIGTGKMPRRIGNLKKEEGRWIIDGIPIYGYDLISSKKQYTVADYMKDANRIIDGVVDRKKLPIVVGGTGLYLKALVYGLSNLSIPIDKKSRQKLEKLSVNQLQDYLKELSPKKWQSLNYSDKQNPRRLIRAIELISGKNNKVSIKNEGLVKKFNILRIGLTAIREVLYQRANERVISRIEQGMIKEAETLNKKGLSLNRMRKLGLEYGALADFLTGKIKTKEELVKILQGKIHSFIRRQITWFKKEKEINWFDITDKNYPIKVENLITKWYDGSYA